ncbi:hypothetical protein [Pontibacter cellulosilyticus]|uniref:Uncharacterized protein n=1 Tax=Pontibacter cellulosilyticus TaxID=1720253 RepID=A0A923N3G0_9BACT|nr:hypothetical protein [Pontibacter cellulosilyticus]MBC5992190.1 hypothetical protein [Pontibacter cellulosilyticus]
MKQLIFGLLALLLLNACEQKEEVSLITASAEASAKRAAREATTNKQWTHRLIRQRAVWTEPTKQTVTDLYYTYNDNGQLAMISGTMPHGIGDILINLYYDELGRLISMQHNWGKRWDLSYDNKNLVKQVRTYSENGVVLTEHHYVNSYDAQGLMTETKIYNIANSQQTHLATFTYTYDGENIVRLVKSRPDGKKLGENNYTYDEGKLPLNTLQNLSVPRYITSDLPGASLSVNNILTCVETVVRATGEEVRNTTNSYSMVYEYAKAGYPSVSTKTFDRGYTERTEFTYETRERH